MKKICNKCKEEKDFSEFNKGRGKYNLQSVCKQCNKLYREANKEHMKVVQNNWYLRNKNKVLTDSKKYRLENREIVLEKKRQYNKLNRNVMNKRSKIYDKCFAEYKTYKDKLTIAEAPRLSKDGVSLEVKCVYCGKYFIPTNIMVHRVVQTLNGTKAGNSRMYCSDGCKKACPTFGQIKYPKSFKKATSREVQPQLRQLVLERDAWTCQKCGKTVDEAQLHCHHILPINESPTESADIDNCITLCKKCHKKVHKLPDCGYNNLRCDKES